jgi:outer membrane protein assembly factor BamB
MKQQSVKNRLIGCAAVAIAGLILLLRDVSAATANAAVAYQINVAHSGTQLDSALSPPFRLRWQVTLPGLVSYPLIADGSVYVTAGDNSTETATLYALDQASGQTIWSRQLSQPPPFISPWANAAFDNGRVFVVGSAGLMTAYESATGTLLWTTQLPFQYLFSAPPTAADGVVYLGGAGTGGTLYAVDEITGSVLATQSVMNGDKSSPAISGNGVFVSYAGDQAYAFARPTLDPLWHYSTCCEGGGGKTPVYDNGRIFTRDIFEGNLILDAATGNLLSFYGPTPVNFSPFVAPAVSASFIWFLYGGTLSAQDISYPSNPVALWDFTGDGQLVTAPVVLSTPKGTFVIEGSATGMLYALEANTGTVVWSANVGKGLLQPDEQNISQPLTGLGAGQGLLVVPAGNTISAFLGVASTPPPLPIPTLSASTTFWLFALLAFFGGAVVRTATVRR